MSHSVPRQQICIAIWGRGVFRKKKKLRGRNPNRKFYRGENQKWHILHGWKTLLTLSYIRFSFHIFIAIFGFDVACFIYLICRLCVAILDFSSLYGICLFQTDRLTSINCILNQWPGYQHCRSKDMCILIILCYNIYRNFVVYTINLDIVSLFTNSLFFHLY